MPTIQKKKDIVNYAILKYIEQNYSTVTLAKLAEKFHYSPQQISIKLKTLTGLTFSGLILKSRMQMASFLLKETTLKIKEIGEKIGYQHPEHFIRTFSKYYQMTPNDYRKYTRSRKS